MARSVIDWTEQSIRQIDQAYEYIALSNSEEIAARITTRPLDTIQQLAVFPMSGRRGRVPGTRELVNTGTPFITTYANARKRIVILAIYHGAQKWPWEF